MLKKKFLHKPKKNFKTYFDVDRLSEVVATV